MDGKLDTGQPRLVLRFALASLAAFLLTGLGVGAVMVGNVRHGEEEAATFHARFVANAVIAPSLAGVDVSRPLTDEQLARVDGVVRDRVLTLGRDVRVKIWRPDGTVVYSDVTSLIGRRFEDEVHELADVMDGHVESGVSDLQAEENVEERPVADKLFQTYVPLRLEPGGPVVLIAELYQRYAVIQVAIDRLVRDLSITFGVGLLVLYAALLPLALRASRTLRRQNQDLGVLLEREQQTVAALRDLDQKKSDFVAAASHELRTPLTSILGYLKTLQQPEFDRETEMRHEFLRAAEYQTGRLSRLIANLLSAAHLEQGVRPIVIDRFDFGELLADVLGGLPGATARVRVRFPDAPPVVLTDRGRMEEVLSNLIENALKYSPGDREVEVGALVRDGRLELWVTDQGLGIDPAHHERIFERFHQVDQSATRRFGGVGLGLHLVKELVSELGGSIGVQSGLGTGSTFRVEVPLASEATTRVPQLGPVV